MKQSKYTNMYELIDDTGHVDTYFKERFKIIETPGEKIQEFHKNNKTWFQEAMEQTSKAIITAIQNGAFKINVEGGKMEDKTIKVRCINNSFGNITLKKEYTVLQEMETTYLIENDGGLKREYLKVWFEKVGEVLIVECVNNGKELSLTLNKKYKVIEENEDGYLIINDKNVKNRYLKERFKPVEPQKEIKEMDLKTVIADIKPNEEYICQDNYIVRCYEDGRIEFEAPSGNKIWFDKEDRFEKIEPKPVTTAEAFKDLDEGKTIKSIFSGYKYKKENGSIKYVDCSNDYSRNLSFQELQGQWIIHE